MMKEPHTPIVKPGHVRKLLAAKPPANSAKPITMQTCAANDASAVKWYRAKRNRVAANIKNPIPTA